MVFVVSMLVAGLASVPADAGAETGCSFIERGALLLPAGPVFVEGVTVHTIDLPATGVTYTLQAENETSVVVLGMERTYPDFNIAFYTDEGDLITNHDMPGSQDGIVPVDADHAVVTMDPGPDLVWVTAPDLDGSRFVYAQACLG